MYLSSAFLRTVSIESFCAWICFFAVLRFVLGAALDLERLPRRSCSSSRRRRARTRRPSSRRPCSSASRCASTRRSPACSAWPGLRRAALRVQELRGVVVRLDEIVGVLRIRAVARAPAVERVGHVADVAFLAIDPGDRPQRAVLLALVGLDLHVLAVEIDGALEVAADLGGVRGVVDRRRGRSDRA